MCIRKTGNSALSNPHVQYRKHLHIVCFLRIKIMNQLIVLTSLLVFSIIIFSYQTGLFLVAYWNAVLAAKEWTDEINKQN